jgi:radical SAM-linked protein
MLNAALEALPVRTMVQRPQVAEIITALSRGDRLLADVIETAWQSGARFEGSLDPSGITSWMQAFSAAPRPLEQHLSAISITVPLPWDHIDPGISRSLLKEEKLRAFQGQLHPLNKDSVSLGFGGIRRTDFEQYCRSGATPHRIVLPGQATAIAAAPDEPLRFGRRGKKRSMPTAIIKRKIRVRYSKTGLMRFLAHLDIVRVFERSAKLAKVPLVYSQGLRRNPKISYGMPLPTGISSTAEYLDMEVEMGREVNLQEQFNPFLPDGIRILQYQGIFNKVPALAALINRSTYDVALGNFDLPQAWLDEWLALDSAVVKRPSKDGEKDIDIRPFVNDLQLEKDHLHIVLDNLEGRAAKISEVLTSLLAPHETDYRHFLVQRTGQFIVQGTSIATPFETL